MTLNLKDGEVIDGLDGAYKVVPVHKWRDKVFYLDAAANAAVAFRQAGYPLVIRGFSDSQVLVQEYPRLGKLAFLFHMRIKGDDHYYPWVWDLPKPAIAELSANGLWETTEILDA